MTRQLSLISEFAFRIAPAILLSLTLHDVAQAAGTVAGVTISNTASVDYSIAGANNSVISNTSSFRVSEKLDVNLVSQDAGNVFVNTPDSNRVTTYRLTNTGNGNDSYTLSVQTNLSGDQFDPALVDIYLDANGNGMFDPGVDTLYVPGSNDPVLAADASLAIFVRDNIPASLNNGDLGKSQLLATSKTLSGAPGTALAGAGDGGTTAVVGISGGSANATGIYEVTSVGVSLLKSVVINDPLGGNQPMTGAIMTYSIVVSVTGSGTASNVVITDPIPANTTYSAGSLSLNTAPLSDGLDGDAGDVGATSANTVTVKLGNLSPASPVKTISFKVIIN